MDVMSNDLGMEHRPQPVWKLLQEMGVGPVGVEWSRPFGTDLRSMWAACRHGELMIGISCQALVPGFLTVLATSECVSRSLPDWSGLPEEAVDGMIIVQEWLTDDADDGDIAEALGALEVAIHDYAKDKDPVCLHACQSVHALCVSILHTVHTCPDRRRMSVASLREASELRMALCRARGEKSDHVLKGVGLAALNEFAGVVRRYIPVEVIAMSCFYHTAMDTRIGLA